ncbi:membrane protein [Butyrivibrio proteoclasticus]|uniref:membrane protein n=1 Tax=Butyrivibrio proteoclasticus TaxID=43305 RepID=UPI00054D17EE|nr:membrane protein [Butyrivibrio proteoclasticus]
MNKLERKFGRYAIPNLTVYILILYAIGYVLQIANPTSTFLYDNLSLDVYKIIHFVQIWRLFTWVVIPPQTMSIFIVITFLFYYFLGTNLERTMGTFRYNVFIFGGYLFMIIAAFIGYFIYSRMYIGNAELLAKASYFGGVTLSTYYLQEMVFLLFAIFYPNVSVYFMMLIPIKVKYLGYAYTLILFLSLLQAFSTLRTDPSYGAIFTIAAILSQFLNLGLFYSSIGRLNHLKPKEIKRRQTFKQNAHIKPRGVTRHKCAVCGRTEETNPELEFRFCSKCNGNYEYCQDHLFTHQHVQ